MLTYKAQLDRARKASLDQKSAYAAPEASDRVDEAVEGLMRPRSRPTPESQSAGVGLGMALMQSMRPQARPEDTAEKAPSTSPRPQPRYETDFRGTMGPTGDLADDSSFTAAIEDLAERRGISPSELYKIIQGESGFNPRAQNASGATGLFQFMPGTARELGVSTSEIRNMAPTEQVALYDEYLERWDYSSSNRLGIMQAAPAFANREPEAVIYEQGSAAWRQNPGWRELDDGPITVRSINSYYARQR